MKLTITKLITEEHDLGQLSPNGSHSIGQSIDQHLNQILEAGGTVYELHMEFTTDEQNDMRAAFHQRDFTPGDPFAVEAAMPVSTYPKRKR